jgi:N-acetylglucosaminyl-diphospho-decaprenol L-rhamnosyltransferase
MDVTFVIPVFNELDYTTQCLESLNRAGVPDAAIVIVDNGSTDGTREFLAGRPNLRVLCNPTNLGCSHAWNMGVQASTSAWTMILNNDVIVAPGLCEGLIGFAEEEHCDIVSPALGEGEMDYPFEAFAKSFLATMGSACRCGLAVGCSFMVHRRVFETVGLFDTKVGLAGNEDEDFFRRAQRAGFRLGMTGRAYLHHFGSVTQRSVKAGMGIPNSARLSDPVYFRKKHRITWLRRQINRRQEKLRNALWRWNERRRFGMTLRMHRQGGAWLHD